MIKGVTELLADLASQLQANNILRVKTLASELFVNNLSADDLKKIVGFLQLNYNHRFMNLLAVDYVHTLFPYLRFDLLTSTLILCVKSGLNQEVNDLLALEHNKINMMGCLVALEFLCEQEKTTQSSSMLKSLLSFNKGEILKIKNCGKYPLTDEQEGVLIKLRGKVLYELARVGDEESILEHRLSSENITDANIECALFEACYHGHYSTVKAILTCYLLGKNKEQLVDLKAQHDPKRVAQALKFARKALPYSHKKEIVVDFLKEFIEIWHAIDIKANNEQQQREVAAKIDEERRAHKQSQSQTRQVDEQALSSLQQAADELESITANFMTLRFSILPQEDDIILMRQSVQEDDQENLEKRFEERAKKSGQGL